MFKTKVTQKIEEKKPKPVISFSGDKPTFGYSALESNLGNQQKAKALQTKLSEF